MFFTPDKKLTSLALKVQALAVTVATTCADVLPVCACVVWHMCRQVIPAIPVAEAH